jgi:tetratricopeptide (TPR) repeat protein
MLRKLGQLIGNEKQDGVSEQAPPVAARIDFEPHHEIVLVMIVKDEAESIEATLTSLKPWITSYCILDTGSTDQTPNIIRRVMEDVPGGLHIGTWEGYAQSRNKALGLAREMLAHGVYHPNPFLLMIDAGERVEASGKPFGELSADGYKVRVLFGGIELWQYRLFRASMNWGYKFERHEVPSPLDGSPYKDAHLQNFTIVERIKAPADPLVQLERFSEDARVFEEAVAKDPNDSRSWFYLAQSYRDSLQTDKAVAAYEKRATMGGYQDEVFYSLLQVARLKVIPLGRDISEYRVDFLKAHAALPSRAEALCSLGYHCQRAGLFAEAEIYMRQVLATPKPVEGLFVEWEIYAWKALDEQSVNLFWVGRYQESLDLANKALATGLVPEGDRARVLENIRHCVRRGEKPT